MSHPPPGQPYYQGQPDPNQPQYGGYPGGPASQAGPSWPEQAQPYSGGPAYPQQPYGAQPPQESYTTEPPYSGQPYSAQPYSGAPYDQGGYGQQQALPGYDQAYQQPAAYPQPAYQATPPPPNRSRGGLIALVASAGVLVLLVCGIGGVLLLRSGDEKPTPQPTAAGQPVNGQTSGGTRASAAPPANAEYPATIILPATVAGMPKLDNAALNKTANDTALKIKNATNADSAVAGYYAPGGDLTRAVGIVGATTRISDPTSELKSAFSTALDVTGIQTVDPGPLGGVMQCGNTSSDGSALTVCGWADGGSLALGIFLNRSLSDSATLFKTIRGEILHRG